MARILIVCINLSRNTVISFVIEIAYNYNDTFYILYVLPAQMKGFTGLSRSKFPHQKSNKVKIYF